MADPAVRRPLSRLVAASGAGETAAALAARHGEAGDRPALRRDIIARRQVQMGEVTWVVKNPETVKYYYFDDSEWGLIELFDGTRTSVEIFEEYRRMFPKEDIQLELILDYEELLRKLELIEQSVAERNLALLAKAKTARQRAAEEKAEGFNPFFMLFHVVDPDRFLNRTVKYVRWIWRPPVVAIWSLAVLWTVGVFVTHWGPIWTGTYELYAFLGKPLIDVIHFFFILSFIGGIHELGHAYATKIYGGDVHDIGIALLYFTPAFYCDTTDSLLFQNKWQKLWVTTAGIYIEGFLCAGATALWVASYPDTLLHELAYKTMLFTGVSTIFFNINPLIKIDGYYALTSILEISELREESLRYLGAMFQRHVLRLPVEVPTLSRRKKRIFWIYGTLALAYTAVIMRFIGGLFYNFYAKYFPNVAIVLLLLTLYRIFRKRVRLALRTGRLFYLDKKERWMSPKNRVRLAAAGLVAVVLLLVPWTRRTVTATALIKPLTQVRLEAPDDAVVAEVLAREGDVVSAGQPVFRLASVELETGFAGLAAERLRLEKEASGARDSGDAGGLFRAERLESSVAASIERDTARRGRLTVRSPLSGRVLTPRLDDLTGRFVSSGELLAEVGDCRKVTAELPVSERLLDDVRPGARVRALLRARPGRVLTGTVVSVAPAALEQPMTASSENEPLRPREMPERFVALAVFENPDGRILPGMIGSAKISSDRASYAARGWRVLRRWTDTIIW